MSLSLFDLQGRVAIVTGASRGIGRAIALGLASAGADIVAACRPCPDLQQVVQEIAELGRQSFAVPTDISQSKDVANLVEVATKHFGKIDILVNDAGISVGGRAEELKREDWDRVLATNLTGTFLCSQLVGKQMIAQKRGAIVNVASVAGIHHMGGLMAYGVTKAGVLQMTRSLAVEWARHNIRVNAIAPSYIETDMNKEVREAKGKVYEAAVLSNPARRFGKPEELVGAAIYLASDAASFVTGEVLVADGGWCAQ